jgi:hypothetical protein
MWIKLCSELLFLKKKSCWVRRHIPVIPAMRKDHSLRLAMGKKGRPYLKNNLKQKRAGGVAQVASLRP